MMSAITTAVKSVASRAGLSLKKSPRQAYPELAGVPRYVERNVKLLGHTFRVSDVASFLASYREIFEAEIYRFNSDRDDPVIVDCGANYGVSVAYFKSLYPGSTITAVEADPKIFEILKSNVEQGQYSNVRLIQKAVSSSNEPITFYSEGADAGRVHRNDTTTGAVVVAAVTLDELIEGTTDFLKVDIEGAEVEALAKCTKLAVVGQMFIEYHSFAELPQSLSQLLEIISDHGFRYYIHTQLCSPAPLSIDQVYMGMDLQLNIFAKRPYR